jgi:ectoine hydroxylase-related dioxygenase (phytanoyl-CoA dioxygenase family)
MKAEKTELTREQLVAYHVRGFLCLDRIAAPAEVAAMREIYDDLFASEAGRSSGDHFDLAGADADGEESRLPQILNVSRYVPQIREFEFYGAAQELARQLLGPGCVIKGEHAINKPANSAQETPWHQDEAYWDPTLFYETVSIWIPLQEVTVTNGCMQFLPGSHRLGVLRHRSIGGDVRVHGLEVDEPQLDLTAAESCPLPAGGATIHGNRMLHYTGPNATDTPRRALIIMAQLPPVRYPKERRFPWNEVKQTARERRRQEQRKAESDVAAER